jgi:autotransporter-associated beta strand protein
MKQLRRLRTPIGLFMTVLVALWQISASVSLQGAILYWDADGSTTLNNVDGTNIGGTGMWDTTTSNWWNLASLTVWPNTNVDQAIFTGTPGTVTVASGIIANRLTFQSSGYVFNGGTLTLAGTTPTIHTNTATTASFNTQILGTGGLTKTGAGTVRLGNATNAYTGITTISNGTLVVGSSGALGADTSTVVVSGAVNPASLYLAGSGYGTNFTFSRNLTISGGGGGGGVTSGAINGIAMISNGDTLLAGTLTSAPGVGTPNTGFTSVNGLLTVGNLVVGGTSGTNYTTFGSANSQGNYAVTGVLSGTGSIQKAGSGTLILSPSSASGFSGTVRITSGSVRISDVGALGTNAGTGTSGTIDLNGGILEVRSDSSLAINKNVYHRAGSSSFFVDHAVGSNAINGTVTFGALAFEENLTTTFNGRNGYNMVFGAAPVQGGNNVSTFTNNLSGLLTFNGAFWSNADTTSRTMTIGGNGNTLINGNLNATGAAVNHNLTKTGTGTLTITGTASTIDGVININGGTVAISDFRAINNNTEAINIGTGGTAGALSIVGNNLALVDVTTSKVINLAGSTGAATILANQTGTSPGLVFNANFTATGGSSLEVKTLTLGGLNTADNTINGIIPNNAAGGQVNVAKNDAGTWVLAGSNSYSGSTTVTNGVLKLKASVAASDIIKSGANNTIIFNLNTTTQSAGGTLEFIGASGVDTTETLGALTTTAGMGTIRLTSGGGGFAANLIFTSAAAPGRAGGVNFITTGGGGGTVTLTGVATSTATTLAGNGHFYINGADFARSNGGVLVAPVYGTDAGFVNAAAGAATLTAASHNLVTGNITAQTALSITSLKMTTHALTLTGNLTVNTGAVANDGGILVTGGTTAAITGGGLTTGGGGTLVFRVDGTNDVLTLNTPMLVGTTGGFTKNGAGTLILTGNNLQVGATTINEGTVRLSGGSARLSGASQDLAVRQGATLDLNGVNSGTAIKALNGAGTITNGTSAATTTLTIGNGNGGGTFSGIIENGTGGGVLNLTKLGTTAQTLSGLNTYTGVTTIGSTALVSVNTLANIGTASSIGRGNDTSDTTNAASLVFDGTTGGITYTGNASLSINRLFTLNGSAAGSGAQIANASALNAALIFNHTGAIRFGAGATVAQTLILGGASAADNQFNLQITDNGSLKTSLTKNDTGMWILGNSNNTYTGNTTISNGILQAQHGTSLSSGSGLLLGGGTTTGTFQSTGNFTRNLSTVALAGANTVSWNTTTGTAGGGGFAASTGTLVVAIGGLATPTALQWGTGGFVGTGGTQTLILNSTTALGEVEFRNAIDLNGTTRTITVNDNTSTFTDFATMTGVISGTGGAGIIKAGTGILQLFGVNTYTGATSVTAGTLVVNSLGHSSVAGGSSVGATGLGTDTLAQALVLGNAGATAGILVYVGAGEISDRYIQINTTTGSTQLIADGTGALVLTNVQNSGAGAVTGAKTLFLRGSNNFENMITSTLANDSGGGVLSVTHDGPGTWILTGNNTYSGTTSANAGALGIGHDNAMGTGTLSISNGAVFAYGGDRTLNNTISQSATSGTIATFFGDYSLYLNGAWIDPSTTSTGRIVRNNIVSGKVLQISGNYSATAGTTSTSVTFDGSGDTIINGVISTTMTNFGITYAGTGSLTLGGANTYTGATTLTNGKIILGANEVIPDGAAKGNVVFNPGAGSTATLDLRGSLETINGLTANSLGHAVIDNTASTSAALIFGGNNQAVNFGTGTGSYTITDSGTGALSIIKTGTAAAVIGTNVTLTYQGTTSVTGGSLSVGSAVNGTTGLSVTNPGSVLALTGGITNASVITSVTVGNGSTLNLLDGKGSKITNLTSLSLGDLAGTSSILNLNVGDGAVAGDGVNTDFFTLLTGGTLTLYAGNQIIFNLTDSGLNANRTYNLIMSADGGLLTGELNASDWILGLTPGGFTSLVLNKTDNLISITTGSLVVGALYWNANGAADNWNDLANWSSNKAGTVVATTIPGQGSDVVFIADNIAGGAAITTTLEQTFKINSLNFEASTVPANTPSSVTINAGTPATNRLEIAPSNSANGISIAAGGSPSVTIAAPLRIGANQTWNVTDATSVLTISGPLQGEADVTKTGAGKVVLSGVADTFFNAGQTTDFIVNGGNLELTNVAALGTVANSNLANIIINGGAFYFNGAASTIVNNLTLGGGTLSAGTATQIYSGAVNVSANSFINMRDLNSATLTTAARNITLSGPVSGTGGITVDSNNTVSGGNQIGGTLTFSGNNSGWSGNLTILRGTVIASSANALGTGAINTEFGKISYTGIGGVTYNLSKNVTIASPTGNAVLEWNIDRTSGTDVFTVNNSGSFTLGGAGGTGELRLFLSDGVGSVPILSGGVILANNGRISVRDALTSVATISDVGISEVGGPRTLTINDVATWGGTAGTLHIATASTYTGGTTLSGGGLRFGHKDAIGTGTLTMASATLSASTTLAGANKVMNAIQLNGTLTFAGNNTLELGGPITMGASRSINANGTSGAELLISGAITATGGDYSLTLGGTGAAVISGGFTQSGTAAVLDINSGTWTITGGTFLVAADFTHDGGTVNLENVVFSLGDDILVTGATSVLNLNSVGVWTPTNPAGTSSGLFMRAGAVVNLNANDVNGVNNANGTEYILVADGTSVGTATFNTNTYNISIPRLDVGAIATGYEGLVIGTGTITGTSTAVDYATGFRFFRGTVSANLAGASTILKQGLGDVIVSGDNSGLTGGAAASTRIDAGNLILDYGVYNTKKIPDNRGLDMRGGTLTVNGNASAPTIMTVASFTLANGGTNRIDVNSNGTATTLNLGAITRGTLANDGTVRFELPLQGAITTTTANTNGILGGWATVKDATGQVNFATKQDVTNNIVAVTTTTQDNVNLWVAGQHITNSTGVFGTRQFTGISSLRLDANAGNTINVSSGGYFHIASGGLLMTENVLTGPHSISGGTMSSQAGELIFILESATQGLSVSSAINGGSGVTKVGNGTLTLSGYNIYSGPTDIQGGTLIASGGFAIGDASVVTLADDRASALQITGNEAFAGLGGGSATTGLVFGTVDFGANTLTLKGGAAYAGLLIGSGQIIKDASVNTGNQAFSGNNTGFTGTVIVNGGLFQISGAAGRMNQATSFTINKGASFLIDNNDDGSPNDRLSDTAAFTLNSADGLFSGQTPVRGLSIRTDNNNSETENIGVLTFNSGASYYSSDATGGTSSVSTLIVDNFVRANSATLNARGTNLGGTTGGRAQFRIGTVGNETAFMTANLVGGVGVAGSEQLKIIPWAIGQAATVGDTVMGNSLVTYVTSVGFRPLDFITEYNAFADYEGATDNVRESRTTDLTGVAGTTVNALVLHNDNTSASSTINVTGTGGGQTLAVTSGALLFTLNTTATGTHGITLGGFGGGITVGSTGEYVIHVVNPSALAATPVLTATISSNLTSNADITKAGRGVLILSGTNTAGGGTKKTTINEGVLEIGDLDNIGGNTGAVVFAGGTLRLGTGFADDLSVRPVTMLQGGGTIDTNGGTYIFANAIGGGGAGGFTKAGTGSLTLQLAVTYAGITTVANGRLILEGGNNRLGTNVPLVIGSGTTSGVLQLGSAGGISDQTVSELLSSGTGTTNAIVGGNAAVSTLTVNQATATTYAGALGGAGTNENNVGLVKTGNGALTLTGNSTFTGGLTIKAGYLITGNSAGALGGVTNAITLGDTSGSAAAVLNIQNTQSYGQTITVAAGSTGPLSILGGSTTGGPTLTGGIILNNNLILGKLGTTGTFSVTGGITGNGNLTLANMGTTGVLQLTTTAVNHAGSITNNGFATVATLISADIGSNVTNIIQDSLSSGLTLSGASIGYTGTTTVNAGVLSITGAAATGLSTTGIIVAGGATLNTVNTAGQSVNLGAGPLNLGGGSGITTLGLELGSTSAYDSYNTTGAAITANSIVFNLTGITGFGAGTYNLLTAASGLNAASYSIGTLAGTVSGFTLNLTVDPTFVRLTSTASAGDFYWRGGINNSWMGNSGFNTNFTTDLAGTINANGTPGAASTVYFSAQNATGPTITTTLDGNFVINDLRFLASPSGVTSVVIAAGTPSTSSLTIAPSSASAGIDVADNAGAINISAPVILGANQTWNVVGTGANGSALTISGTITGAGNLEKTGDGILTFAGASTYTGTTTITAGILQANAATRFSALSAHIIGMNGVLRLNGFNNSIGSLAGAGIVQNNAATSITLTAGANNTSTTFSGVLQNGFTGTLALTKTGTGTLILTGANTHTGTTTVSAGVLQIGDGVSGSLSTGTANLAVSNSAITALLRFMSGTSSINAVLVGNANGATGSFNMLGGVLNANVSDSDSVPSVGLGTANGGFGALQMSGGTMNLSRFYVGGTSGTTAAGGIGTALITGGTINVNNPANNYIMLARHGASIGVLTITGGTLNHNAGNQNINLGWQGSGRAELNVAGGLIDNTTRSVVFGGSSWTGTGILNLNAGVLLTSSITHTSGTSILNFNGGTLRAAAASTTFVPTGINNTYVNGAFGTFAGGAVIDTNGFATTIPEALVAPTGNGVTTASLGAGGSGYTGAPYVQIAGDGVGATGYAVIDIDPLSATYGQVTGVVITNPGVNYTSATITLVGGGGTGASASASLAANTSGGLTKIGAGVLTLSGANTYTGGTNVLAGTLALGANDVLADSGAVTVNGGIFDVNTRTETVGAVTLQNGSITSTTGILTGSSYNLESGTVSAILAGTGSLTKTTAGTVTLSGVNTFSGSVNVNGGILAFGAAANLGNGSATNVVNVNGGTMRYTGAGAATFTAAQSITVGAGNATFDVTNPLGVFTAPGNVTGSAGGDLIKTGAGTLVLSGTNNLGAGGAVNVVDGILRAGFGTNGAATITVSSSGTLEFTNGAAQALTLNGTTGALTMSGGAALAFELGAPGTNDSIIIAAGGTALVNGTITLNLLNLGGLGAGTYDLITILGGGGGLNAANFVVANAPAGFNYTINKTDNLVQLITSVLSLKYWRGDVSNSWAAAGNTNWSSDAAGTIDPGVAPGAGDTVIFSASNAPLNGSSAISTTLDGNRNIDSLQFLSIPTGVTGVTIAQGSGGSLTIAPVTSTNGILVAANAGLINITAPLVVGAAQTWSVDSTGASLVINGIISFGARVTKTGSGVLTLTGNGSGTGGLTLAGGTLNLNGSSVLGTGTFTIGVGTTINNSTGGTVTLSTNNAMVWDGNFTFTGTQSLILGNGAVTLGTDTVVTTTANTLTAGGAIGDGADNFLLTKAGAGTLTLSGASTWSGGLTLSAGTLNINSSAALGTGLFTINAGTINNTSGVLVTQVNNNAMLWNGNFIFTGANALNLGTGAVTLGTNVTVTTSASTLTVGGVINDGVNTFNLTKTGAGTLHLTGQSTYSGSTIIEGPMTIGVDNALPTGTALTVGNGTTVGSLNMGAFNQTVAGLSASANAAGTSNITISAAKTLTVNGNVIAANNTNNATTNLTMSGGGALVVNGATFTVGNNTTGTSNSSKATVNLAGLSSFTANLTGALTVQLTGDNVANISTLILSNTANSITASAVTVGGSATGSQQVLVLGGGTNVIHASTINIGTGSRDAGLFSFGGNATGSIVIRDTAGTGRAAFNMATGGATTSAGATNIFNVAGHNADLLLGAVNIGTQNRGAAYTNTFSFDQGTLDMSSLTMSTRTATSANGTVRNTTSTMNIGGGIVNIQNGILNMGRAAGDYTNTPTQTVQAPVMNATLNISGGVVTIGNTAGVAIRMAEYIATNGLGVGSANGVVNITGGTVTVNGDIVRVTNTANASATVILDGISAVLDMTGDDIGTAASQVVFNADQGTLMNLGELNGGAGLTKGGLMTLILEGLNTYTGGTTINVGVLQVGTGAGTGTLGSGTVSSNGILRFNRNNSYTVANTITGIGSVEQVGTGTTVLEGNNDYSGGTSINAGTLQVNSTGALGTVGEIKFAGTGGTLQHTTNNTVDYSARIANSTATVRIDTNGQSVTYASSLAATNTGGLRKEGTGALRLNAANSYGGTTTVNSGTLVANNTTALSTGDVVVNAAGTLSVGDGARLNVNVGGSLSSSGTLQFDIFSRQAGSNPVANNDLLTLSSLDSLDTITLSGTLSVVDTTGTSATTWAVNDIWQLIDWAGFAGVVPPPSTSFSGFGTLDLPDVGTNREWSVITNASGLYISIVVVPEPSRVLLLGLGFTLMIFRRRRR